MTFRKVSNLQPGDRVKFLDMILEIDEITDAGQWFTIEFIEAAARTFHRDDLIEIVML